MKPNLTWTTLAIVVMVFFYFAGLEINNQRYKIKVLEKNERIEIHRLMVLSFYGLNTLEQLERLSKRKMAQNAR